MKVKHILVLVFISTVLFFIYSKTANKTANDNLNSNIQVLSTNIVDLDSDGRYEEVVYYYTPSDRGISTRIKINNHLKVLYDQPIEKDLFPRSTCSLNTCDNIVGFINLGEGNLGIVIKTSTQGSGGFSGYKVIGKQDTNYKVIYEQSGLKNGKISITGGGNYIQEEYDYPLASDSNCCSTNIKYRLIKFENNKPVVISEVQEKNYWLKFRDAISKTY